MTKEEFLERHLELCKQVFLRMKREDSWPWREVPDSSTSDKMLK